MPILQRLPVDEVQLEAFCRQWKIAKLELFGSMLVEPSSARDIDLLVTPTRGGGYSSTSACRTNSPDCSESSGNALRRNAILGSAIPTFEDNRPGREPF
jgi:hypothetical protein